MLKQTPIVEVNNLVKRYLINNMIIKALDDINLSIKQGDMVSIVGKSGSGKSTLMHLIGALDRPTSGTIKIDGGDISKIDDISLAKIRNKKIGFVFQQFNLLPRISTLENVLLPLKYSDIKKSNWDRIGKDILEKVDLSDRMQNKPNELSGGQQQRVAIARALVNNPNLILADEPTGNLDSKTGKSILNLFKKLNKEGKTVILVTHDNDIAKQTNTSFKIKDGKLI